MERRDFFKLLTGMTTVLGMARATGHVDAQTLQPTPSCPDGAEPTPRQTEGPYFKPASPERASLLEPGMKGVKIVVTGVVRLASCQPVPRALIDVWHADDRGDYDNAGYRLRGHQFTDDQGRYRLETIVPGVYPGRTRHFHLKVQAPKGPVLTTQLYFPGEAANASDPIFKRELVLRVRDGAEGKTGTFDFVLRA
jgi:protocatechuate 3,4-dioxygenase beta subunit